MASEDTYNRYSIFVCSLIQSLSWYTKPAGGTNIYPYRFFISLSILIYFFRWIFYRNPSNSATVFPTTPAGNPLVSVIIPIYNQQEMIENVIDAISGSSYNNIEIIAVDDGSTDGTKEVLDNYKLKYPSVLKVIHKRNEGKRKAVASGFFESSGKYIVLIDSDSVIDRYAIEEFMKTFSSKPDIGAISGLAKLLNSHKNFLTKMPGCMVRLRI